MSNYTFAYPWVLWLLLLIPVMALYYIFRQNNRFPSFKVTTLSWSESIPPTFRHYLHYILFVLRLTAIALLIIVAARPQIHNQWEESMSEGIDIVLALDISTSMLAEDFKPNRMEAAKEIAAKFISGRGNDRIGLVIFSGESFTQCPLTTDHAVLINLLNEVEIGMIEDGTAIGMGLATSVNRLRDSESQSKIVILLTDGVNNRGAIDPLTAAQIAETFNVRVYTIGVGSRGLAPYPVQTPFGIQYQNIEADIDEEVLTEIAGITGGRYFRAEDEGALLDIYTEIEELEKSKIEVRSFLATTEQFKMFALIAGLILVAEWLLRTLVLRTMP